MQIQQLEKILLAHQNPEKAVQMKAYMKDKFSFYGIQSPVRKTIFKEIKSNYPINPNSWQELAQSCYDRDEREWQYMALEIIDSSRRYWSENDLAFIENLVTQKSWWDTVDWLASILGKYFQKYPKLIAVNTERWNTDSNMWLNRVSIIFQLHLKEKTDWMMMQKYILKHRDSKEFFIQKAQGWALRQYAKSHPEEVLNFLRKNPELSNLTHREATKHLK